MVGQDIKWKVAITTAPRKEPTLSTCIESLEACGWTDIAVLAEPESDLNNIGSAKLIKNEVRLGTWHNWVRSVRVALESDAQVIMTVQDDSVFHPDSKEFAESVMWPATNCGFVSLYTPRHYTVLSKHLLEKERKRNPKASEIRPPGVRRIITRSLWGACALVWPRQVLENIIDKPLIESWLGAATRSKDPAIMQRRKANPHLIANSDTAIGKLMNWYGYSMWFVDPSPVAHIAKYSAIGHGGNSGNPNAYRVADHSIPLADQVFGLQLPMVLEKQS